MEILERYSRQLPLVGVEGQKKLFSSRIIIAGLGGLGSLISIYLAAAGVGELILVDSDVVEESNLNRQILYDEASLGLPKVYIGAHRLRLFNSNIKIYYINNRITYNLLEILEKKYGRPTLIIDALDNWSTRLELDKYTCERNIPLVHGAIDGLHGQLVITKPKEKICLRCLAPTPTQKRDEIPSLGAAVGAIASIETLSAISIITGKNWITPGILYIISLSSGIPTIDTIELKGC